MGLENYLKDSKKLYNLLLITIPTLSIIILLISLNEGFNGLNITWPPTYYILRDRIPFFLTLIYFNKSKIPQTHLNLLGLDLFIYTIILTGTALGLYLRFDDMTLLAGIHWSAPSPIEWGLFIVTSASLLYDRGLKYFEGYYLSFLAAMGGGWLYEAHNWIIVWNPAALLKINAIKVFFIEFQLICLPLLIYIVSTSKQYKRSLLLIPIIILSASFYALTPWLRIFLPPYIGQNGYRWIIRVPTMLTLFTYLCGIRGEKI